MSEAKYDGELCEGCTWFSEFAGPTCTRDNTKTKGGHSGGYECESFTPSLQCRQVRALERIADSMDVLKKCLRYADQDNAAFVTIDG